MDSRKKKIVLWGAGTIGRHCIGTKHNVIDLIIDRSSTERTICDIPVIKPDEYQYDKAKCFIVIAVKDYTEIETFLIEKGLDPEKDFTNYVRYFGGEFASLETEELIRKTECIYKQNINKPLVVMDFFDEVRAEQIFCFLNTHFGKNNYAMLAHHSYYKEKDVREKIGVDSFQNCPKIMDEYGHSEYWIHSIKESISSDERGSIDEIIEAFGFENCKDKAYLSYYFYKCIIKRLNPTYILAWGAWNIDNYVLQLAAGSCNTEYRFIEFGEIPGTILVDSCGIEGHSEYSLQPEKLEKVCCSEKDLESAKRICKKIVNEKRDSYCVISKSDELDLLKRIRRENDKIILFIGMDDKGLQFDGESLMWNSFVSSSYKSSYDAGTSLAELCTHNNWKLVYKPHPNSDFEVDSNVTKFQNIQIEELIERADVVVSLKSKSDYKTLMMGKPLVQIGKSLLSSRNCTYEANCQCDLERTIMLALERGCTHAQRYAFNRHVAQLLKVHLWDDNSARSSRYGRRDSIV